MKYLFIIPGFFIVTLLCAQDKIEQHVLLKEIKTKYQAEVSNQCDTFNMHLNDEQAKGRVAFLNKDFSTTVFSNNSSVAYWYCNVYDKDSKKMQIGFISILFTNEKARDAALKKIKSSSRTNFKVKVLTEFKVKASKNELLIVFSETVRNKSLAPFWEKII